MVSESPSFISPPFFPFTMPDFLSCRKISISDRYFPSKIYKIRWTLPALKVNFINASSFFTFSFLRPKKLLNLNLNFFSSIIFIPYQIPGKAASKMNPSKIRSGMSLFGFPSILPPTISDFASFTSNHLALWYLKFEVPKNQNIFCHRHVNSLKLRFFQQDTLLSSTQHKEYIYSNPCCVY